MVLSIYYHFFVNKGGLYAKRIVEIERFSQVIIKNI